MLIPAAQAFPGGNCGIFTSVTGTAPNRQFNIEWRAVHFADTTAPANFEVVFYENQSSFFDVFYGATSDSGLDETSGVQASSSGPATTFSCGTATLTDGLKVTYTCAAGGGRRRQRQRQQVHPVAAQSTGALTRAIRHRLIGSSAAVFRKPVQRAPHVRSLVIQLPRHYDSYTFTNTTGATQCVTVDTNTALHRHELHLHRRLSGQL